MNYTVISIDDNANNFDHRGWPVVTFDLEIGEATEAEQARGVITNGLYRKRMHADVYPHAEVQAVEYQPAVEGVEEVEYVPGSVNEDGTTTPAIEAVAYQVVVEEIQAVEYQPATTAEESLRACIEGWIADYTASRIVEIDSAVKKLVGQTVTV